MKTLLLIVAMLLVLAAPVSAGSAGPVAPDVAEIEDFTYDECQNVFHWTATSEIIIYGYRLESHDANWFGAFLWASSYGSHHGASYAIYGPQHADLAGDYLLRVYYDTGVTVAEDVAERVCNWEHTRVE